MKSLTLNVGNSNNRCLIVGGLHAGGAGYPNARQTLRLLHDRLGIKIIECGVWLPETMQLWRLTKQGALHFIAGVFRLAFGNLLSLIRVFRQQVGGWVPVYVPYPAVFILWWASWLPGRLRPEIVADAYISPWDAMFRDRHDSQGGGWLEYLLKRFEARAYRAATVLIVDTEANRSYMAKEFGLPIDRLVAIPLAIEEDDFLASPSSPATARKDSNVNVLFVGTLIPLHGLDIILGAIENLLEDTRLSVRIIGNGQMAPLLEEFMMRHGSGRVQWIRTWCDLPAIADEISRADICLGVFGGTGKASRVLPFKLYLYMAAGKPVISQQALSTPGLAPYPPISDVHTPTPETLAKTINELIGDVAKRKKLGAEARTYYLRWLSNQQVVTHWQALLGLEVGQSESEGTSRVPA